MRKNQLSFTIESFGDQALCETRSRTNGYIDGNNIYEVLQTQLKQIFCIYNKDSNQTFEEFCNKIRDYDAKHFGRAVVDVYDKDNNKTLTIRDDIFETK